MQAEASGPVDAPEEAVAVLRSWDKENTFPLEALQR